MRISCIHHLLIGAMISLPVSAQAEEPTLMVDLPSVALLAPTDKERELVGKTVWAGDAFGVGKTGVLKSSNGFHRATRLSLAYTWPTEFVSVFPRQKIDSGAIYDAVAARAKDLGAPDIEYVQFEEVAHVDLDADGRMDTVVLAFTERDRTGAIPEQPGDITAVFLVAASDGRPQIMDQIVVSATADGPRRTWHFLTPLSMAKNSDSGEWNLLVVEEVNQWRDKTFTSDVIVRGRKMQQTKTIRMVDHFVNATGYALKDRKLSPIDGLQYGYGIAGEE